MVSRSCRGVVPSLAVKVVVLPLLLHLLLVVAVGVAPSYALKATNIKALQDLAVGLSASLAPIYNWTATPNCANWYGIDCDLKNENVISIDITCAVRNLSIPGFPTTFRLLSGLKTLRIKECNLNFSLPANFFKNFTKIQAIYVTNNTLRGILPSSLSDLTTLTQFDVGHNKFYGPIPDLSKATGLRRFDLSNNLFSNDLSELNWIGDLRYFSLIDISSNKFFGQIPPKWANVTSLTILDLAQNNISGWFPETLYSTPRWNLTKIFISDNFLQGNASAIFARFPYLLQCGLGQNSFSECANGSSICCAGNYTAQTRPFPTTTTSTSSSTSSSSSSSSSSSGATITTGSSCYPPYTCQCSSALFEFNGSTCNQGTWQVESAANSGTVVVGSLDEVFIAGNYTQDTQAGLIIYSDPDALKTPIVIEQNAIIAGTLTIILTNPVPGKSNISVINASTVQGVFDDIQIQTSYSQGRCNKITHRPIYSSTGVLLELTTTNTCSDSTRRKQLIIGISAGVGGLVLITIILAIVIGILQAKGKLVWLYWSRPGEIKNNELLVRSSD